MGLAPVVSGRIHRNDWFHDWLADNGINDEASAYKEAKNPSKFADLLGRARAQQTEPVEPLSDRSIIAGRSLDLTGYLACGHANCLTRQVDDLFRHVWHYFDKIAISGPEAHLFLDAASNGKNSQDYLAKRVAELARPIFYIREIGADKLVTWVSKPPACTVHWKEYKELEDYQLPEEAKKAIGSRLLEEGRVMLEKKGSQSRLTLRHPGLFAGSGSRKLDDLQRLKEPGESLESTLARLITLQHWVGAASDLYTANSIKLPIGLGIGLEARMAGLQRNSISPAEVAFDLVLPVVDGLPVKELISLRESENDAFEGFRDCLTKAIKERVSLAGSSIDNVNALALEIQSDVINPALHRIQRQLRAAEGVLQKNSRYNIAIAGLATVCGVFTTPDIATAVAAVALAGTGIVGSQFVSEKRDIALDDMYFLWKAKEYAQKETRITKKPKYRKKHLGLREHSPLSIPV